MADQISPAQMREIQKLMETMKRANNPKKATAKKAPAKKAAAAKNISGSATGKKIAGPAMSPSTGRATGRGSKPMKALIAGAAPAMPKRVLSPSHMASGTMNKQMKKVVAPKPNIDQRIMGAVGTAAKVATAPARMAGSIVGGAMNSILPKKPEVKRMYRNAVPLMSNKAIKKTSR